MANIPIRDQSNTARPITYLKATGAGTNDDPFELQVSSGGIPVPITDTSATNGPFTAIQASGNGCTFSTTGLTNDYSGYTLAAGQVQLFGQEVAATVTLPAGECTAFKVDN